MKRGGLWAACVVVLIGVGVLAVGQGSAQDAAGTGTATCSVATLRGTYLFTSNGFNVGGKFDGPFAAAGYNVLDGRGRLKTIVSYSLNGKIGRFKRVAGRYTVNADCTGTIPGWTDTPYGIFVAREGSTMAPLKPDAGTVWGRVQTRVTARGFGDWGHS